MKKKIKKYCIDILGRKNWPEGRLAGHFPRAKDVQLLQ